MPFYPTTDYLASDFDKTLCQVHGYSNICEIINTGTVYGLDKARKPNLYQKYRMFKNMYILVAQDLKTNHITHHVIS